MGQFPRGDEEDRCAWQTIRVGVCRQPGIALIALYLVAVTCEMNENLKYELGASTRREGGPTSGEGYSACVVPKYQWLPPKCYSDRHAVQ